MTTKTNPQADLASIQASLQMSRSIVSSWLKKSSSNATSDSPNATTTYKFSAEPSSLDALKPRPPRLGVGAKPKKSVVGEAETKLEGILIKDSKRRVNAHERNYGTQRRNTNLEEDEIDHESRESVLKKSGLESSKASSNITAESQGKKRRGDILNEFLSTGVDGKKKKKKKKNKQTDERA